MKFLITILLFLSTISYSQTFYFDGSSFSAVTPYGDISGEFTQKDGCIKLDTINRVIYWISGGNKKSYIITGAKNKFESEGIYRCGDIHFMFGEDKVTIRKWIEDKDGVGWVEVYFWSKTYKM